MGSMESATTWTLSQPYGIANVGKWPLSDNYYAKVKTFPPPQRKFADIGTRRDHRWVEIAKPLILSPQNFQKGFRPSMKDLLQVFPICCYISAVMVRKWTFRRRALRRPLPTRREVSCGDTDMDWPRPGAVLHMELVSEAGPTRE